MRLGAIALLLSLLAPVPARADPRPGDDTWRVRPAGPLTIDSQLVLARPAALPAGLSTGVGAGVMFGRLIAVGGRASWSTASESSSTWAVTHADLKLRAAVAIQHAAGRGSLGLRLALGPTIVHESRTRNQGVRAGLSGSDLETSAFAALPSAELEAVVAVGIAGPWLLTIGGGPSLSIVDGSARAGWTAQIGAGWRP